MATTYKDLTRFLHGLGTEQVEHTERNFLAHLIGVYGDLKQWGCSEEICRAGMFHSIYGTQKFQRFCLPIERRDDVKNLIGTRAEILAYANCFMNRESFDAEAARGTPPYRIRHRVTGAEIPLSEEDFTELCRIHLCDWLEQVPHSQQWDYRRPAYRRLAEMLGGVAEQSYRRVFALEPVRGEGTR